MSNSTIPSNMTTNSSSTTEDLYSAKSSSKHTSSGIHLHIDWKWFNKLDRKKRIEVLAGGISGKNFCFIWLKNDNIK